MIVSNIKFTLFVSNLNLSKIENRRMVEDILAQKGDNYSFNILAIPEPAPLEIPRMIGQTQNGHSQLQIANNSIILTINFDEKYNTDIEKCFKYSFNKINNIIEVVKILSTNVNFTGIVIQYIDTDKQNPMEFLQQHFVPVKCKQPLCTVSNTFAVISKNRYYINISHSNISIPNKPISLGIVIDINNRYYFNSNGSIEIDDIIKDIERIKRIHIDIAKNKLKNLFNQELNFDEE